MLNDNQFTYLQQMLEALEPELPRIYERGRSFVEDQIARFKLYQQDTRVSERQWKWLEDLYKEHVAIDAAGRVKDADPAPLDLDDELKF